MPRVALPTRTGRPYRGAYSRPAWAPVSRLPAHSLATDLILKEASTTRGRDREAERDREPSDAEPPARPQPPGDASASDGSGSPDEQHTRQSSRNATAQQPLATSTAEAALRAWRGVAEDALSGAAAALAGASLQIADAHGKVRRAQTAAASEVVRRLLPPCVSGPRGLACAPQVGRTPYTTAGRAWCRFCLPFMPHGNRKTL